MLAENLIPLSWLTSCEGFGLGPSKLKFIVMNMLIATIIIRYWERIVILIPFSFNVFLCNYSGFHIQFLCQKKNTGIQMCKMMKEVMQNFFQCKSAFGIFLTALNTVFTFKSIAAVFTDHLIIQNF